MWFKKQNSQHENLCEASSDITNFNVLIYSNCTCTCVYVLSILFYATDNCYRCGIMELRGGRRGQCMIMYIP